MTVDPSRTEDVADFDPPGFEGVGDQAAVAAPGDRFSAEDGDRPGAAQGDEPFQGRGELGALHVVGVAAEGFHPPGGVRRVGPGGAPAAKARLVHVFDAGPGERCRQGVAGKLWKTPGAGVAADVHQQLDAVFGQQRQELADGARGVADRQDGRHPGYYRWRSQPGAGKKQTGA